MQTNKEDLIRWYLDTYKNIIDVTPFDDCDGLTYFLPDCILIAFNEKITLPVLYHEIGHACFDICDAIGIDCKADNAETFLYMQEYIAAEFFKMVYCSHTLESLDNIVFWLEGDPLLKKDEG